MKATYLTAAAAIGLSFGLAACIPRTQPPAAPPPPVSRPAPPPAPPPTPTQVVEEPQYENYLDAPPTPGTWEYVDEPSETLALYGSNPSQPVFLLRCGEGQVALARVSERPQTSPRAMSVTTETGTRQLQAVPVPGRATILAASLAPADPLLDAMAITKGRFAIAVEGQRTLYLPAWTEVSRVIEDCR